MKLLVTGATGFVGSNVTQYLIDHTDLEITRTDFDVANIVPQTTDHYDFILNIASISSVERSLQEPAEVIKNNVMLATNMLEFARQNPPKLFVQFSTIEAKNITNPYAASKRAQEVIAKGYAAAFGVPVVVVRATNIIGKGQSRDKFIPKLIDQIRNNEKVSIYATDGKPGSRHYNPVENIADALLFIMGNYEKIVGDGVYIPGGETMDNLQMAQTIAKLLGKELDYELVEAETVRPGYLQEYQSNNELPGWEPVKTLEEGLRELL